MDFASSTEAAKNKTRWKMIAANSSVMPRTFQGYGKELKRPYMDVAAMLAILQRPFKPVFVPKSY